MVQFCEAPDASVVIVDAPELGHVTVPKGSVTEMAFNVVLPLLVTAIV